MARSSSSTHRRLEALALVAATVVGCASVPATVVDPGQLDEGVARLNRPLPGDLAALYRMRVAKSGGLRLAVAATDEAGRLTISEPFGSAVSLTAWQAEAPTVFFDLREGCRREVRDLAEVLGVGALPLAEATRLLGGRLPAVAGDLIEVGSDGEVVVTGLGWAAAVRLAAGPWRVVEVEERTTDGERGWRIELDDHTSSVPGRIRIVHPDGRWAELDLARLEWPNALELPDLPELPLCED
jgi:hypothetical protein